MTTDTLSTGLSFESNISPLAPDPLGIEVCDVTVCPLTNRVAFPASWLYTAATNVHLLV